MSRFVLDASVVAAWFLPDQRTASADRLLGETHQHRFLAPHIFPVEVLNLLLTAERKARISAASTARAFTALWSLNLTVAEAGRPESVGELLTLAREDRLTAYDALYLQLAQTSGAALATRDGELISAAGRRGLDVLDLRP